MLVPVSKRPEPLDLVYHEYADVLGSHGITFEFLFLIEPLAHEFAKPLLPLMEDGRAIRVLEVGQAVSESALLRTAAFHARGSVVLTLPPFRRVEASALPQLISALKTDVDVVVARRWPRRDPRFRRLQNRLFHTLVANLGAVGIHDAACGVRVMRRDVLLELPLHGDLHRFFPLFAMREGYRVREVDVPQHSRDMRTGRFTPGAYLRALLDLFGLFFLLHFKEKPLRFFGLAGGLCSSAGMLLLITLIAQRYGGQNLGDRPLLVLAVMLIVLGLQAIALGLIGEIVVHLHAPSRRPCRLVETTPEVALSPDLRAEREHATSGN